MKWSDGEPREKKDNNRNIKQRAKKLGYRTKGVMIMDILGLTVIPDKRCGEAVRPMFSKKHKYSE